MFMAKKTNTAKKKSTNKASTKESKSSLLQKFRNMRAQRRAQKAENRRHKQTDEARKAKAEKRAIRENALEQVNKAVIKSKQRRSYPGLVFLSLLVVMSLSGALVWQYRQSEIDNKQSQIEALKSNELLFADQQRAIEEQRKAEEAKFNTVTVGESKIRIPAEWSEQVTTLPKQEIIYGDDNVSFSIVSAEDRNSVEDYRPRVDYVWTLEDNNGTISVASQSLHCSRFDTLNNDLSQPLREHNNFRVYCDDNQEVVRIFAAKSSGLYGLTQTNSYFEIEVRDLQQLDFDSLKDYIESYSSSNN